MIQIKQNDLTLYSENKIIPAQYSENIPVSFVKQQGYEEYAVLGAYAYRDGCKVVSGVMEYNDGQFILPANPFQSEGTLAIGIKLVGTDDSPSLGTVEFYVRPGLDPNVRLPEEKEWSEYVKNLVEQLIESIYGADIQKLIDEAKLQQEKVAQQQIEISEQKIRIDELIIEVNGQQNAVNELMEITGDLQTAVNDLVADVNQKLDDGEFIPNISIGETITGAAGTEAIVTQTGTRKDPVFSFTIPQGLPGPTVFKEEVNDDQMTISGFLLTEMEAK